MGKISTSSSRAFPQELFEFLTNEADSSVVSTRGETNLWAGLGPGPNLGSPPTLRVSSHSILYVLQYVRLNAIIQKIGPSRSLSITCDDATHIIEGEKRARVRPTCSLYCQ
jgi:hypothetical protein